MTNLLNKDTVVFPPYVDFNVEEGVAKYGGFPIAGGTVPPAYRPDSGYVELLWLFRTQLVTSASAVKRTVTLDFRDENSDIVWQAHGVNTQSATATIRYHWSLGLGAAWQLDPFAESIPLPGLPLLPGWSVTVGCVNEDAADVFGASKFIVWQFPTGNRRESPQQDEPSRPVPQPITLR